MCRKRYHLFDRVTLLRSQSGFGKVKGAVRCQRSIQEEWRAVLTRWEAAYNQDNFCRH